MEKELNSIEISVEVTPIYTLLGSKEIVKLSDFVYGYSLLQTHIPLFFFASLKIAGF